MAKGKATDSFTQADVRAIKDLLGKAQKAQKLHIFGEGDIATLTKVIALFGKEENEQMIVEWLRIGKRLQSWGVVGKSLVRAGAWSATFAITIFASIKTYDEAKAVIWRYLGW